ncbi:(Fe-S)-binding protein [Mesoterricola silvestris]|uniref:Fe-S oxidoreductase n=1 Tax=Mesoterricola silvestris TaxID=2927979 RepID=A0AA48GIZ4_9BACT|nr:(Fe-S)-binding protein [Mesoterricola silvestris]BDU71949.1 Fe-S oxidoreductase [Mesoterricola silvestris]
MTPFSPATSTLAGLPAWLLFILIPLAGLSVFAWIIRKRLEPLLRAAPDPRRGQTGARLFLVLKIWLAQWRHPRYLLAGVLHIILFFGFLVLGARSFQLVFLGIFDGFTLPGFGHAYDVLKDYASTATFLAVATLAVRRAAFRPERYAVPESMGKDHTPEALLILGLILTLLLSESLFEGSLLAATGGAASPLTLAWAFRHALAAAPLPVLGHLNLAGYVIHDLTFFLFLCFLPLGKHFHVITSLFNVFWMRVGTGNVKPVRHGVDEAHLDEIKSFGVKTFEDFTWKHMLDFYSCADCGRCSDRCPANFVKRPLSPRFISIKARDYAFSHYPLLGEAVAGKPLVGSIFSEDEIWSCTTCGACEEECPLGIEYVDKIVDLRRGMVDEGLVPQSMQKPLSALEKRGNPWGKLEKKRADWTADAGVPVKQVDAGDTAPTLYFVDSISSYDDRMQKIAQASARILAKAEVDFVVLGKEEKDSGHDVRRFGEEMLFQSLKDHNTEGIRASQATRIVTNDPHALNALRNDYSGIPPVQHMSELIAAGLESGKLRMKAPADGRTYTYHDPCYLGRHNGVYDPPRNALDAIPGLKRVEMEGNCRDRSFCCGGGGLMLFYEPQEEKRMGVVRVEMARKAGADVIVTACPYCLTNIEDAIKVAGLEGKMEAIDLCELVDGHLQND